MIHEYALEPELVASWHDLLKFRLFIEMFGFGSGRVVSRYPKKWTKQVWDAFEADFGKTASPVDRSRMGKLLKQIAKPVVKRPSCIWDAACDWLTNAEIEHTRKPFHAILARNNPRHHTSVVRESAVLEDTDERWDALITVTVPRNAQEMANCVAPMLRCATRILFVDPNFDSYQERYKQPLSEFLRYVDRRRGAITIELHAGDHRGRALPDAADRFRERCRTDLPRIIPTGLELTVYYWKERLGGKELHNRFILTDIGGVQFGYGLDCDLGGGSDDTISRLDVKSYSREWNDYAGPNFAFDLDGEPSTVEGRPKTG